MRLVEAVLILANLLTFCILTIGSPPAPGWMGYLAPIALLIAGIQVLVERSRWQMAPAYALAILFFLIWSASIARPGGILPAANRVVTGVGSRWARSPW